MARGKNTEVQPEKARARVAAKTVKLDKPLQKNKAKAAAAPAKRKLREEEESKSDSDSSDSDSDSDADVESPPSDIEMEDGEEEKAQPQPRVAVALKVKSHVDLLGRPPKQTAEEREKQVRKKRAALRAATRAAFRSRVVMGHEPTVPAQHVATSHKLANALLGDDSVRIPADLAHQMACAAHALLRDRVVLAARDAQYAARPAMKLTAAQLKEVAGFCDTDDRDARAAELLEENQQAVAFNTTMRFSVLENEFAKQFDAEEYRELLGEITDDPVYQAQLARAAKTAADAKARELVNATIAALSKKEARELSELERATLAENFEKKTEWEKAMVSAQLAKCKRTSDNAETTVKELTDVRVPKMRAHLVDLESGDAKNKESIAFQAHVVEKATEAVEAHRAAVKAALEADKGEGYQKALELARRERNLAQKELAAAQKTLGLRKAGVAVTKKSIAKRLEEIDAAKARIEKAKLQKAALEAAKRDLAKSHKAFQEQFAAQ
ncbi:MAG: hypothetical protein Q7V62_07830 [Actinomycetota bacterium]|nr:hypothetical protein [Actinomycetota bacterium]